MSVPAAPVCAEFRRVSGPELETVVVHFNPTSLKFQITNTQQQRQSENAGNEYVSESTGQLTMDLVFDTTGTGQDVRLETKKLALFMKPENRVLPTLKFKWGAFEFEGTMGSFQETIDYFSSDGVPLRSAVAVTLKTKSKTFDYTTGPARTGESGTTVPGGGSTTSIAQGAGDPSQGRALAAANGLENMRFTAGAGLFVAGGANLRAAVAFSAGGGVGLRAGAGAGAGFGAGAGAGFGVSAGAGFGVSAGAGAGAGFGVSAGAGLGVGAGFAAGGGLLASGRASAGVTAAQGAFAGLRFDVRPAPERRLHPERLLAREASARVATGASARFAVGGQAVYEGSASLATDVGRDLRLRDRLQFEEG